MDAQLNIIMGIFVLESVGLMGLLINGLLALAKEMVP